MEGPPAAQDFAKTARGVIDAFNASPPLGGPVIVRSIEPKLTTVEWRVTMPSHFRGSRGIGGILLVSWLVVSLAGPVGAIPPDIQVLAHDDPPLYSAGLSLYCGIAVYIDGASSITVKLFRDASGEVVSELDDYAITTVIYSPLEEGGTGESFSPVGAHRNHLKFSYPEGTELGAPVTIYMTGAHVSLWPGYFGEISPGMIVYSGEVVDTWNGIPIVEIVDLIAAYGAKEFSVFDFGDHLCAALGAP
jgi:hypothetical protein